MSARSRAGRAYVTGLIALAAGCVAVQAEGQETTRSAQLSQRVASSYPAYRLSTRRDIASRFSGPAASMPTTEPGRPWWIGSGDFDGDTREDVLIDITYTRDSSRHLAVVLFGSGRTYAFTSDEGVQSSGRSPDDDYVVMQRGTPIAATCDGDPKPLPSEAVARLIPEQGGKGVVYWQGGRIKVLDSDCT